MSVTTVLSSPSPTRLQATRISYEINGRRLVSDVSLSFRAGELVAIVGGSGAGKTTLLESLAGVRSPTRGSVTLHGQGVSSNGSRGRVAFVPQEDIIHLDLPLRRTLRYAARLRLPRGTSARQLDLAVQRVLEELDLADRDDVRVRDLSGGQRKRASIAVELLTHPDVLFLDEPTSGLDPATAAEVLQVLGRLAEHGTTVVLTSHSPTDVHRCDRVIVLAGGGLLAFDGSPAEAVDWFGVDELSDVYTSVTSVPPHVLEDRFRRRDRGPDDPQQVSDQSPVARQPRGRTPTTRGSGYQLVTLAHRSADIMTRSRLTAVILLGSPTLVIAMLAIVFRPGAVGSGDDAVAAIQLVYWIAFAGFFFGLTYGLLQIVTEAQILRRERSWGLSLPAYVASKVVVLLPLLIAVDVALFVVLRLLDRLPGADPATWMGLGAAFLLDAAAGLALGLLASAAVINAAQATLALPMLCFPQVLFAGAMVPVETMTAGGRAISQAMSNRWAFEGLGRILGLGELSGTDPGPLGAWAPAFAGSAFVPVAGLIAMAVACTAGTVAILHRRMATR